MGKMLGLNQAKFSIKIYWILVAHPQRVKRLIVISFYVIDFNNSIFPLLLPITVLIYMFCIKVYLFLNTKGSVYLHIIWVLKKFENKVVIRFMNHRIMAFFKNCFRKLLNMQNICVNYDVMSYYVKISHRTYELNKSYENTCPVLVIKNANKSMNNVKIIE